MATKYFVYAGLQFQTEEVALTAAGTMDACTLESVVTALGADIVTDIDTLKAWWGTSNPTDLEDRFQIVARNILNQNAGLAGDGNDGIVTTDSGPRNFHLLSCQYILPPHLENAIDVIATESTGDENENSTTKLCVKALQVRHDNIVKHLTADAAWQAYIISAITEVSVANNTAAMQGYYINPSAVEPD